MFKNFVVKNNFYQATFFYLSVFLLNFSNIIFEKSEKKQVDLKLFCNLYRIIFISRVVTNV